MAAQRLVTTGTGSEAEQQQGAKPAWDEFGAWASRLYVGRLLGVLLCLLLVVRVLPRWPQLLAAPEPNPQLTRLQTMMNSAQQKIHPPVPKITDQSRFAPL